MIHNNQLLLYVSYFRNFRHLERHYWQLFLFQCPAFWHFSNLQCEFLEEVVGLLTESILNLENFLLQPCDEFNCRCQHMLQIVAARLAWFFLHSYLRSSAKDECVRTISDRVERCVLTAFTAFFGCTCKPTQNFLVGQLGCAFALLWFNLRVFGAPR